MVTLNKIAHLALGSCFDSIGQDDLSLGSLGKLEPWRPGSWDPLDPSESQESPESSEPLESLGLNRRPENFEKLKALGIGTRYDVCTSSCSGPDIKGICHSFTHDGRCISLFKTLFTNSCSHQCNYCINAAGCRSKPAKFSYTPKELAGLTISLYRSNYIEGLFLSSGAGRDGESTMEGILETAKLLRERFGFRGYIHLKILPGASEDHIRRAMELADRVSINLEAASPSRMSEMSSTKDYHNDIIQRQRYIRDLSREGSLPAGQTTQLVVGASHECDEEIFRRVVYEYREMEIRRAYYSAFQPLPGTPFSSRQRQPLWRERRLYQVDWLYRVYGFSPEDIGHAFDEGGFLSNSDPKAAIARALIDRAVDPNTAEYRDLIRIPGIGPRSARRIIELRTLRRISGMKDLSSLGVRVRRAAPFLKINGWKGSTLDRWSS